MGHALNGSIQDSLIRWHRMRGFDTLWQPGYDHAGISTQNVVEKQLIAEGTSRQEIGREAFLERTWAWLETTGRTIMGQFRQLGCSLDYSRERFTMDDGYVEAVMTYFVRLWEAGWIYRANRIVNWCPYHQTAISDLEVEHVEMDDTLTYARYPFADGSGLDHDRDRAAGDDPRRRRGRREPERPALRGRDRQGGRRAGRRAARAGDRRRARRDRLRLGRAQDHARPRPDRLRDRPRPRPADAHGHRARRARDRRGLRGADAGGGRRARRRVAEEHDQLEKRENYRHSVGTCERCHSRIEPLVSPQWWCPMDELARPAIEALRGAARPLPPREPAPLRDRVARARARLVRLAPALVGPPDPDLDVSRRPSHVRVAAADGVRRVRLGRARARPGRARHVVLVGALAVRDARLAGARRRSSSATTRATSTSPRARSSASGRTG